MAELDVAVGGGGVMDRHAVGAGRRRFAKPAVGDRVGVKRVEPLFQGRQRDPVLGSFGPGYAGSDRGKIQVESDAVVDLARSRDAEHFLGAVIVLEGRHLFVAASCQAEIVDGLFVHRKKTHGGAVLGRHVGDGGTIGDGQRCGAVAVELDEFADHLGFAQHLGDVEGEIGGGDPGRERPGQVDPDDFGGQEINRLAEHAGLGLDAAHTPADDPEAVDHGGVGIGADESIRVVEIRAGSLEHALGEVLEVDLVNDPDPGRDNLEGAECLLPPLE